MVENLQKKNYTNINNYMTIYICGAGPTGLSLAWLLKNKGQQIVVIEKYKAAGGTWAARWLRKHEHNLFTQHSPQVFSTSYVNTLALWKEMGIDYTTFLQNYVPGWLKELMKKTSLNDKLLLGFVFLLYMISPNKYKKITVQEQFQKKLSASGWDILTSFCYLVDGVPPSIMTVHEIYEGLNQTILYKFMEMSEPSDSSTGFITQWMNSLNKHDNISFQFNTKLEKLSISKDNKIQLELSPSKQLLTIEDQDQLILALDPLSLSKVLSQSDEHIKNNWGDWNKVQKHIQKGIYTSLSVQYHFSKNTTIIIPYNARMGVTTEWGVISMISNFNIPVLSTTVLNMNAFSSFLNKTVNECNPNEVKTEVWRQLKKAVPSLPNYQLATTGTETAWNGENWSFDISSAARTILGPLPPRGKRTDIAIVGPLNYREYPATSMEAAVECALRFSGNEDKIKTPYKLITGIKIIFILVIIFIFYKINKHDRK